jgi:hypothetical protein
MNSESDKLNIKGVLEITAASTSVVAAIGYGSQRAYLNYLGIGGLGEVSVERLLYEAYTVLVASTSVFVIILGLIALLSIALILTNKLLDHRSNVDFKRLDELLHSPIIAAVFTTLMICDFGYLLANASMRTGVLFYSLSELKEISDRSFLFPISILSSFGAVVGCGLLRPNRPWVTGVWSVVRIVLPISMLWVMVVVFNVEIRGLSFPIVALSGTSTSSDACALLVYSTDKLYVLWSAPIEGNDARGMLTLDERSGAKTLTIFGLGDLRQMARTGFPCARKVYF